MSDSKSEKKEAPDPETSGRNAAFQADPTTQRLMEEALGEVAKDGVRRIREGSWGETTLTIRYEKGQISFTEISHAKTQRRTSIGD